MSELKYRQLAGRVRAMIADGTYKPGQPVMSGTELARRGGCSPLTGRQALRLLVREGVLEQGVTPGARHRVAGSSRQDAAARALSGALAAARRAAGLTQPQLAAKAGVSATTIGHAETGRIWHSAAFWERADAVLGTGGDLVRLHAAHRAAAGCPPGAAAESAGRAPATAPRVPVAVLIVWSDGTETVMRPGDDPPR